MIDVSREACAIDAAAATAMSEAANANVFLTVRMTWPLDVGFLMGAIRPTRPYRC